MGDEQLEALVRANANLVRRLAALEQRVAELEGLVGRAPQVAPEQSIPPAAKSDSSFTSSRAGAPGGLEARVGVAWLNRIAVVTCFLAAAFFFKYAAEANWLGPVARVATGVVVGLLACLWAEWLSRRGLSVYAQGMVALGAGLLYLSCYSAFAFYQLVGATTAFLLLAAVTVQSSLLAIRYRSLAVAVAGFIGGYATPALLTTGEPRYGFVLAYLLALSAGAIVVARYRQWRVLEWVAAAGGGALYLGMLDSDFRGDALLAFRGYAFAYWLLLAASARWPAFFLAHGLVAVSLAELWNGYPTVYSSLLTGLGAAALTLSLARGWAYGPAAGAVSFLLAWGMGPDNGNSPSTQVIFYSINYLLLVSWIPLRLSNRRALTKPLDLVLASLGAVLFYAAIYDPIRTWNGDAIAPATALLAVGHAGLAWLLHRIQREPDRDEGPVQLYALVAAALAILAIPLAFAGWEASMAWSLEALALAWIGKRFSSRVGPLLLASAAAFALAVGELFLAEASRAPLLAFVVTGAALLLGARLFPARLAQGFIYTAGHSVLLSGLIVEARQWAWRQAPDLIANLATFSVSAVMALYGMTLIGVAVALGHPLTRRLGLLCVAAVVAKLYLYDVWTLRLFYRVVAFATLGALLLITSFLYSKYRSSLDKWIQLNDSSQ
jgi:uncharacterized membrane protein